MLRLLADENFNGDPAWKRTPSGTGNWTPRVAQPRWGDRECCTISTTLIVIDAVEGNPTDQQRALNHLAALEQTGHRFAISDLTRTECLAPVFGPGSGCRTF